jgi:hypothetical protein
MANDTYTYSEPVHESIIVVGSKIVFLQFLIALSSILIHIGLFWWVNHAASETLLITCLALSNVLLQTADATVLIYLILQWMNTGYIITPQEIVVRRGIAHIRTAHYKTEHIEAVRVLQTFPGKLFNYGTVQFHNYYLDEEIVIPNIPNPHRYSEIIRSGSKAEA